MDFPEGLKYTKTHEWVAIQGNKGKVGVTAYAQKEISDVVFVELPKKTQALAQGKAAAVVESVKAAFDIYAPLSGQVTNTNAALESNPGLVNQDPYGDGWLFEMDLSAPGESQNLLTAQQYQALIQQSAH